MKLDSFKPVRIKTIEDVNLGYNPIEIPKGWEGNVFIDSETETQPVLVLFPISAPGPDTPSRVDRPCISAHVYTKDQEERSTAGKEYLHFC